MKLDEAPIDFASRARARKARFIIEALAEYCRKHEPRGERALLDVARSLSPEGRLLVETRAHELMGTKKPKPASDTTWAQVLDELEARADQVHEAALEAE